jgi:hypothetical protein
MECKCFEREDKDFEMGSLETLAEVASKSGMWKGIVSIGLLCARVDLAFRAKLSNLP